MIVFGTRGKVVPGSRKQGVVCPSCGKEEHTTYGVLRYFHIFWIPVFPTLRQPMLECAHCRKVLAGKEIPERTRREIAEAVFTSGRMLPMFTGLALALALLAFGAVQASVEAQRADGFLAAPAVGDLYVVKLARFAEGTEPRYPYGLLRVAAVRGAELELQLGRFGYAGASGAEKAIRSGKHREPDYFSAQPLRVPVQELPPLKAQGHIHAVKRP